MSAMPFRGLLAVLIAIKAIFLWLDPTVRLYLGDSAAYLYGAMDDGRLPDDRSFTYSLLIRALVSPFDSLWPLLPWQTLAGVGVALLLGLALHRYFGVPGRLAVGAACLLAIEPAQLFYERMVLAETFGLLWFVGFYAAAAAYLASGRILWIPLVAAIGLLAATFRLNYLPVVLVISLGVPLIRGALVRSLRPRTLVSHLALALCAVVVMHGSYRSWVAAIFSSPPGYLARAGFMQVGLVTPLIRPEHFERVGLPRTFADELQYPLSDPDARMPHMWRAGGLVRELARRGHDVERISRELSRMAIADDPFGLVRLGAATVGNYFTTAGIEHALDNDLGRRDIPGDILWSLREQWNYDATGLPTRVTVVSRYFEAGTRWLVACLFLLIPLSVSNVVVHWRSPHRAQAVLAALFGIGLVLAHVLFVNVAFYRYLHPLPFFVLLNGLAVLAAGRPRLRSGAGRLAFARRRTASRSCA
ncbi:MAG TPA: hypothetical protein VMO26_23740 [Vicinamibacterales bacterium]|nr:hypothetical protein [Vicinamibacterales bacterium]